MQGQGRADASRCPSPSLLALRRRTWLLLDASSRPAPHVSRSRARPGHQHAAVPRSTGALCPSSSWQAAASTRIAQKPTRGGAPSPRCSAFVSRRWRCARAERDGRRSGHGEVAEGGAGMAAAWGAIGGARASPLPPEVSLAVTFSWCDAACTIAGEVCILRQE